MRRSRRTDIKRTLPSTKPQAPREASQLESGARVSVKEYGESLLAAVGILLDIARRRDNRLTLRHLESIAETIGGLPERIVRSQLPESVTSMIVTDARLDALIAQSQLKVALMYDHQELLAPNEQLRKQFQDHRRQIHDEDDEWLATCSLNRDEALVVVRNDLEALQQVRHLLRDQAPEAS